MARVSSGQVAPNEARKRATVLPCYLVTLLPTEPTAVRAEYAKAGRTGNANQQR